MRNSLRRNLCSAAAARPPPAVMTGGVVWGEREKLAHEYLQFREWTVETLLNSRLQRGPADRSGVRVNWISKHATVESAVRTMVQRDIGSLLVCEEDEEEEEEQRGRTWLGIITERDYLKKVLVKDLSSREVRCEAIMTPRSEVVTVTLDSTLYECMDAFDSGSFRHLPVVSSSSTSAHDDAAAVQVLAVFSQRDLVHEFKKFHATNLQYIESYVDFPIW